ncbi:conserved hypothetical protein [Burkholderia diffusa]|nr:conserved hypothetical protein [Burkholderia diffusa]
MRIHMRATLIPATSKALPSENPNHQHSLPRKSVAMELAFSCRFSTIRLRYTRSSEPDFHSPSHAASH